MYPHLWHSGDTLVANEKIVKFVGGKKGAPAILSAPIGIVWLSSVNLLL